MARKQWKSVEKNYKKNVFLMNIGKMFFSIFGVQKITIKLTI